MADYKKLYYKMFNTVTDAEKLISQAACMMRYAFSTYPNLLTLI